MGTPAKCAVSRLVMQILMRQIARRLTMGHIKDKSLGGEDTPGNLRAVCTNCNEGLAATSPPRADRLELLRQVRRANVDDQLHLLHWLEEKFKNTR